MFIFFANDCTCCFDSAEVENKDVTSIWMISWGQDLRDNSSFDKIRYQTRCLRKRQKPFALKSNETMRFRNLACTLSGIAKSLTFPTWPNWRKSQEDFLELSLRFSPQRMCCTFYLYLPISKSHRTQYLSKVPDCKVTRSREKIFQHTKLHHCSYISLLNLQHILTNLYKKVCRTLSNTYIPDKESRISFSYSVCIHMKRTALQFPAPIEAQPWQLCPKVHRTPSIIAQCRSMSINADQNHGIDPKCLSIPIIERNWEELIDIDRHWDQCQNFEQHWSALISIGHWSGESWVQLIHEIKVQEFWPELYYSKTIILWSNVKA